MTIQLTNEEKLEYFLNALCNGLYMMGLHGLELVYDDNEYNLSKQKLESPCYEDVFLQILKDGYKLTFIDREGSEDNATIGIEQVYERMDIVPASDLVDMAEGNDDACTADSILQTVFLGKIIYG